MSADALLQIIFMREYASLGPPARARGIHDRRHILTAARDQYRLAIAAKFLPAFCSGKLSPARRLGDEHHARAYILEAGILHDRPPDMVLGDQKFGFRMSQQLELLGRRELVIQGNQHAAAIKNGIGGDQPLRLVRHDDRGASAISQARILQRASKRVRNFLELAVGEADFLAVAVRFDQANLIGPAIEGVAQRFPEAIVFSEIEHQRRD